MLAPSDRPELRCRPRSSPTYSPDMTLRNLALASTLGMLASGLVGYFLPVSPTSAPMRTSAPPAPPPEDALPDHHAPVDLAEAEQEIARLRALLTDAPSDASATAPDARSAPETEDASPPDVQRVLQDGAAAQDATEKPPASMIALPPGHCRDEMTQEVFDWLLYRVPAMRQLPAEKLRLMKSASPTCACPATPAGQARCEGWCSSQGFAVFQAVCDQGWCRCGRQGSFRP